jgi:hypothetical protein
LSLGVKEGTVGEELSDEYLKDIHRWALLTQNLINRYNGNSELKVLTLEALNSRKFESVNTSKAETINI